MLSGFTLENAQGPCLAQSLTNDWWEIDGDRVQRLCQRALSQRVTSLQQYRQRTDVRRRMALSVLPPIAHMPSNVGGLVTMEAHCQQRPSSWVWRDRAAWTGFTLPSFQHSALRSLQNKSCSWAPVCEAPWNSGIQRDQEVLLQERLTALPEHGEGTRGGSRSSLAHWVVKQERKAWSPGTRKQQGSLPPAGTLNRKGNHPGEMKLSSGVWLCMSIEGTLKEQVTINVWPGP